MKRWRVPCGAAWAAGCAILVLSLGATVARAEDPDLPPAVRPSAGTKSTTTSFTQIGEEGSGLDGVFLPPDRQVKRRMEVAEEMIGERRYGEAVRLLGSLLEGSEDFFFKPSSDQPVFRSLKAESGRLLAGMPLEGRASYELQFGARARQMLEEAAAQGDLIKIADVSRRFFYTQAGAEATYLLGRHYLDENRPLAAVMCFERLRELPEATARLEPALSLTLATCWLRAGKTDKALQTLEAFRQSYPSGEVTLAGKPVKLFAGEGQALAWMEQNLGKQPLAVPSERDQWVMFRGDETRNAPSVGGQPLLSVRWRQRTCDDAGIEQFVDKLRHDYLSQDIVALPSMHPLAVNDVVLMRTAFALQAVDFETGKLIWKYAAGDESLEQFLRAMAAQQSGPATQQMLAGLDSRMWEDTTYGTLSSDTRQVYYIEDLAVSGLPGNMVLTVLPSGQRRYSTSTRGTNRLAARELRTQGKLKWAVGGQTGEDEPQLAGAFFLGPPLPLMGQLYALAEVKGQEIRLVVLSPETGELLWSQQLAVVDPPVTQDNSRRNAGATPSYADGVLVCPTAAGAIVGMDLSTRSLLWGYQYPRTGAATGHRMGTRAGMYGGSEPRMADHWSDGSITIVDGRVLVSPTETDELFCLDLFDGKELWKKSRGDNLYVACVHEGKVIVVGHKSVSALNLSDGSKAWPDLPLPTGAMPTGRGFYSGHDYYLPLSTAAVTRIDLNQGAITETAQSRSGTVPGNLICYRDSIISQSADDVEAFYQLDVLKNRIQKNLAENPNDPRALAALGEIKLDEKSLPEAIELFRRSYAVEPAAATRVHLTESLLAGLRTDFAAYRDGLAELETLIEQPRHRIEYLRLKAMGLQQAGENWLAFETYIKLIDEQGPWEIDEVDANLSVRRDRWLREQMLRLRLSADQNDQMRIDEVVRQRFKAVSDQKSVQSLRTFVNVFGPQPAAQEAAELLADQLSNDDLLEQNLLLEADIQSANEGVAGQATAHMAEVLRAGNRSDVSAVYYRLLNDRFAEVKCQDDKTGKQLVEELPEGDPARALLAKSEWLTGKVKADHTRHLGRGGRMLRPQRAASLEKIGPEGPLLRDVTFSILFDAQQYLVADDGDGNNRFRILLSEQGVRRVIQARSAYSIPSISYASVRGGLVVLSMGTQLMAIDTLRSGDSLANRILWTEDLSDQLGGLGSMQSVVPRAVGLKWGGTRFVPEDGYGRRYGMIGPVSSDGVYYQRLHDLYCVDPLTGKTIWMRKNVQQGLDLFGDGEYLLAAPPGEADTLILRAATGEQVGTCRVAPLEERVTTVGRNLLAWKSIQGKQLLEMRDAVTDKAVWSFEFISGSKAALVGSEVVGVFQPDGLFSIIRLEDGRRLTHEQLAKDNMLLGIHLLPSEGGYLLATNAASSTSSTHSVQAYPNSPECPLVTGRIYAFDRVSGKPLWPEPVKITQQGLLLSQPRDLPVLTLLRQVTRPGPISSRDPRLSVMCIDKRTGKIVYHREDLQGTTISGCVIAGDPAQQSINIVLPNQEITLTYTQESEASPPAEVSEAEKKRAASVVLEVIGLGAGEAVPSEEAKKTEGPAKKEPLDGKKDGEKSAPKPGEAPAGSAPSVDDKASGG